MPPDRDRIRLLHMLEHAREAMHLVAGRNRSDLDTDRVLSLALVRLLEIVGEAPQRESPPRHAPDIQPFRGRKSSACETGSYTATMPSIWTSCGAS